MPALLMGAVRLGLQKSGRLESPETSAGLQDVDGAKSEELRHAGNRSHKQLFLRRHRVAASIVVMNALPVLG
jgi:hypothetical protein